jgi:hypothetical protein
LSPIRDIIAKKPAANGNGNGRKGRVKLVSRLESGQEVEFDLGAYPITPATILALRNISGVLDAAEI